MDANEYSKYKDSIDLAYPNSDTNASSLEENLRYYADAYYNGEAEIPDWKYDILIDKLKSIKPNSLFLKEVGAKPRSDAKVKHKERMLSLEKMKDMQSTIKWATIKPSEIFIMEAKADGVAVDLAYNAGRLYRAVTRGDGEYGEDVTRHANEIPSIPKIIPQMRRAGEVNIRGEIVLHKDVFKTKYSDKYSNPRNTVSGMINRISIEDSADLTFYAYSLISDMYFENFFDVKTFLMLAGFRILPGEVVMSVNEIPHAFSTFVSNRDSYEFEIDGVVIKVNNMLDQSKLGNSSSSPNWACCVKFEAKGNKTILLTIIPQIGRTGEVTPVAIVDPVTIDNVEITRITMHNYARVANMRLKKGDVVYVIRANDVIPRLEQNLTMDDRSTDFLPPDKCITCNSKIIQVDGKHFCKNPECPDQSVGLIRNYIKTHKIMGIGDETIKLLIDSKLVTEPHDLYKLTPNIIEQLSFDGVSMGWRRADSIFSEIAKSKDQNLDKFIQGLGLPLIGEGKAEDLAKYCKNIDNLLNVFRHTDYMLGIKKVDGFGETILDKLMDNRLHLLERIQNLLNYVNVRPYKFLETPVKPEEKRRSFNGMAFSITGTLSISRDEVIKLIKEYDGVFNKTPKIGTGAIIIGDKPGASKLTQASKNGVPILYEAEFMASLGSPDLVKLYISQRERKDEEQANSEASK